MPVKRRSKRPSAYETEAKKLSAEVAQREKTIRLAERAADMQAEIDEIERERDDLAEALRGTQAKLIDIEGAYKIARAKIDRLKGMVGDQQIAIAEANGYIRRVGDQDIAREGVTVRQHSEPVPHAPPVPTFYAAPPPTARSGSAINTMSAETDGREPHWSDAPWATW